MRRFIFTAIVAVLMTASIATARHINDLNNGIQFKKIELQSNRAKIKLLDAKYEQLNTKLEKTGSDKKQLEKQLKGLEADKAKLQSDLQAKIDVKNKQVAQLSLGVVETAGAAPQMSVGCNTGNQYKDFIYMKESGCSTTALNSIGCYGIGQACPSSKISHCGSDFSCQDAWFSNYATTKYGSWAGAYQFWLQHSWW